MISVLYIDDEPDLLELCRFFLEQSGDMQVETVQDPSGVTSLLKSRAFDIIVCDYQMPELDGISLLKTIRHDFGEIPFILFTGRGREEVVIDALNNGADFYLQKGGDVRAQFTELSSKIRQAVLRRQAQQSLRESEKLLFDIINFLPDATFAINRDGVVIAWNRAIEEMTGVPSREMVGRGNFEYALPFYGERRRILINLIFEPDEEIQKHYSGIIRKNDVLIAETSLPRPMGMMRTLLGKASALYDQTGAIIGAIESIRDITEQKQAGDELRTAYDKLTESDEELRNQYEELVSQETLLRQSETKFRAVADASVAALFVHRIKILYANPAAEILTGFSLQELTTRDFLDLIHPDDRDRIHQPVSLPPEDTTAANRAEFRIMHKDGSIRWVDASTTSLSFEGMPAALSVQVDITERIQAESELRAAYEQLSATDEELRGQYEELAFAQSSFRAQADQLREIASTIPGVVFQFYARPGGVYGMYYVSERSRDILNIEPDTATFFDNIIAHAHPDDLKRFIGSINDAVDRAEPWFYEGRYIRPSGEVIWLKGVSHPAARSGELVYSGVILDITARKSAEAARLEIETRYSSLADAAEDLIFIIDRNDTVLYVNRFALQMIGRKPDEIIGKPRKILFPGQTGARQYQSLQRVLSTGNPLRIESAIPLPSGDTWQDTHLVPLRAPDGSVTAVLGISRDITRFRQAQVALKRSNEKLNLLNNITRHDVANQLTILNGYIQLARMQEPDTIIGDFLKKIEGACDTIQRQIEFTRAYQDLGVLVPDWFRLDEILARTRPAGLVFTSLCNSYEIFSDPMLEKVFFNLFDNAVRHGERVTSISVRCQEEGDELHITIEDDGIGIPLDEKQKIFQKGFGKNTGYGLFLVREILAITNIQIHETGRYGSGARFEISVPRGGYRHAPLLPQENKG